MTLRIGCIAELPLQRLQAFLGALHTRHPGVGTELTHLAATEQLEALRAGELDLAVIHHDRVEDGIEMEPLFHGERLAAFLPVGHRLAHGPAIAPGDVGEEVLLVFRRRADPALHDRLIGLLNGAGYQFRAVRETGGASLRDTIFAVAEGHGITLAPASTPEVLGELGTLVVPRALQPAQWMPDTMLAWRAQPDGELATAVAAAREAARLLYASQTP